MCGGTTINPCPLQLPSIRVYPRVCGGTCLASSQSGGHVRSIPACAGEPRTHDHLPERVCAAVYPRVCGGTRMAGQSGNAGSIPACAGEPRRGGQRRDNLQPVYPRVCGGTVRRLAGRSVEHDGSIPACAGEPIAVCDSCGSTYAASGLSPRVRGNQALGAAALASVHRY